MHQRERCFHPRITQVGEILVELLRQQHAFINERLVREAGDVPVLRAPNGRDTNFVVGAFANDVKLALESGLVRRVLATLDENLADEGLALTRRLAEHRVVDRHRARTEIVLPFGLNDPREDLLDATSLGRISRHEDEAAGVPTRLGQADVRLLSRLTQEGVGHLHQDAGAIAGVDLTATRAAVIEVFQNLDGVAQDGIRLTPLDVGHEAKTTSVALITRVVQTLLAGPQRGSGRRINLRHRRALLAGGERAAFPVTIPRVFQPINEFRPILLMQMSQIDS